MKASLPILALLVGAVLGWFVHNLAAEPPGNEIAATPNGAEVGIPHEEHEAMKTKLEADIKLLKTSLEAERQKSKSNQGDQDDLLSQLKELEQSNKELKAQLGNVGAKDAERMAHIEERFKKLQKMGVGALLSSTEIGKLVADLLQQGESGKKAVLALLNSEDENEQMLGVVLMMQGMASVESIDPLSKMAMNGGETMAALASQVLMRMEDKEAIPALEKLVSQSKNEGVKVNSLFGLAKHGSPQGVQQLLDYYNDDNSKYRDALTDSFFVLRNPESQPLIDAVVQRYSDKSESVRNRVGSAAIDYYTHVKTPSARRALQNMVDDPGASATLRQQAQDALNGL